MSTSRDTCLAPSNSGVGDILLESFSLSKMHSQGLPSSSSGHLNPAAPCFCPSLSFQESGRLKSFNSDTGSGEHTRITMKTRVAVRDKDPHRFQVVPLRDVVEQVSLPPSAPLNRLTVPTTPTGYLPCSPPKIVSSYSQPKSIHPSLSTQFLWGNSAKASGTSEGSGTGSNSIKKVESFDNKREKPGTSFPPLPVPSLDLNKKNVVLTELDLNRPDARLSITQRKSGISLLLETTQANDPATTSSMISPSKPFSKGNQHAISQSLHVKSRHDTRCLKFNSLTHIPKIDMVSGPAILLHKMESLGDSLNFTGRGQSKAKCLSSTLEDRPKTKKRCSKKRHGMYTPSLLMPYIQGLALSEENSSNVDTELAQIKETQAIHDFAPLDQDMTMRQELQDFLSRLDVQDTPRRIVDDPFEILPSGSMDFLPIDSPLHHSSPKATAATFLPNLTFSDHQVLQSKNRLDSHLGDITYPEIILDLFVEIDKAIDTWSTKAM